jgi:hypothetical protein
MVYTLTSNTTMESAMLKEKNASRSMGGMGRIIIASSINSRMGIDRLPFHKDLMLRNDESRVMEPGTVFKCSNKPTAITFPRRFFDWRSPGSGSSGGYRKNRTGAGMDRFKGIPAREMRRHKVWMKAF